MERKRPRIIPERMDKPAKRGRPFIKGQSGNPAGKPPGSRHRALLALDAIGQAHAAEILRVVVEAALNGDLRASEIILRRVAPEPKGRTISFDAPEIKTAADLPTVLAFIMKATADGILTPDEATSISQVAEALRKTIETADHEARLSALEAKLAEQRT